MQRFNALVAEIGANLELITIRVAKVTGEVFKR